MPEFLKRKLKKEYPGEPGKVYATMNALGYMRGNKETAKGREAERKHKRDMRKRGGKSGRKRGSK